MIDAVVPIILLIGLGVVVAWRRLLSSEGVRHVSDLTFQVFIPTLLFYAMARTEFDQVRWSIALAYFVPTVAMYLGYQAWLRARGASWPESIVRSMGISYPNSVMLTIPVVTVAFGQDGMRDMVPVLMLNSLILLAGPSVLIETVTNRGGRDLRSRIMLPLRRAVLHPFVLALVAGMVWSGSGLMLPAQVDHVLQIISGAASPLCLIVLGASLAQQFEPAMVPASLGETLLKLVLHPALVWATGFFVIGLPPLALAVVTLIAATATGANTVLFAHRYQAAIGQISAVAASSTALGLLSLPVVMWLVRPG